MWWVFKKTRSGYKEDNILEKIDKSRINYNDTINQCVFRAYLDNGNVNNFMETENKDGLNQRHFLKSRQSQFIKMVLIESDEKIMPTFYDDLLTNNKVRLEEAKSKKLHEA